MSQKPQADDFGGELACVAYEEEAIPERDPRYNGWIWDNHIPGTLDPHDEVTVVRLTET